MASAQVKYSEVFTALGANLGVAALQLGVVSHITAGELEGELILTRMVAGEKKGLHDSPDTR